MADDQARAQEQDLLDALRARRAARAAVIEADRDATEAARTMWSGPRRAVLPLYLWRAARQAKPHGRVIPLGTLPWSPELDAPEWRPRQVVGGVERLGLAVDAPSHVGWELQLDGPAAACGWFALRSEVWTVFVDPLELVVRMVSDSGATLAQTTLRLHPAARAIDRRWVPWRLELPAQARGRLEVLTRAPAGALDRAWLLIGDPVLDLGIRQPSGRRRRPHAPRRNRGHAPKVALLMPVHDPAPGLLEATLSSVARQTSAHWELCVVDDGSRDQAVIQRLRAAAAADPRIRLARHEEAQGISAATNRALALTGAPFVATLDHDDLLHPEAIELVGRRLAADPRIDVLYTDNDLVAADGTTFAAALKPDWSPDLLRSLMYTLHLGVYRRALVEEIGGWRSAFDGAQDHDLMLRLSERTDRIAHLPRVLAHWRAHAGSAALGELAKPDAYERGRAAIREHLERTGVAGVVEPLPWPGRSRVRLVRSEPATVLLPRDTPEPVLVAWRHALRDDDAVHREVPAGGLPSDRPLVIAEAAVVPRGAEDVDELLGHLEAGAAAAGGLVVDEQSRVLAGPVAFPDGLPVGLHVGADASADDRHRSLTVVSNRTAVRGVVALRSGDHAAAALGERLIAITARAADAGERVVFSPHAWFTATPEDAQRLRRTSVAAMLSCDRGSRPDPHWHPLQRSDRSNESYDERIHDTEPT